MLVSAAPEDRRELLYGPGGIFGPKGPFSTPVVRYPHGLEVKPQQQLSGSRRNVRFDRKTVVNSSSNGNGDDGKGSGTQANNNNNNFSLSESSAVSASEDRSVKSHYVVNAIVEVGEEDDEEDGDCGDAGAGGSSDGSNKNGKGAITTVAAPASSRMETYRAEWAEQELVAHKPMSKPLVPQDVERWREEKARR